MDYFPLFIRINDARCLIVGGGEVALRKCRMLLRAGARLRVLAPEINAEIRELATTGQLEVEQIDFDPTADLREFTLIVAATNDRKLNSRIAKAAAASSVFCNVVDDRELSTAIMPAIVDRNPLLVAISSGGASPVLVTRVRQQIEKLLPTATGKLARFADRWRPHVKHSLQDESARRRFWQTAFDGPVADLVLRGEHAAAEQAIAEQLAGSDTKTGFAWIVGAGPGDPELLTIKAARILAGADTILHDRLVAPGVLELARRDATFISVGKEPGKASISQEEINELLTARVQAGERVCRLKGGDPFIFGRGGEEIEALEAAGLPWQVIPGITAASGCAAAAGVPLTHRQLARSVTFVTAYTADKAEPDWNILSAADQTVVFYMGVRQLDYTCRRLIAAGRDRDCPALIVENGTTDRERMIRGTLTTLPEHATAAGVTSPALLIVGSVTELNQLVAGGEVQNLAATATAWSPAAKAGGM
jgi:uroporphyrin-III C-methyltransferase/precorrin-2 dehydrogenase/sirohydrochlorin ferrochelatase